MRDDGGLVSGLVRPLRFESCGHPRTPENVARYVYRGIAHESCRSCRREAARDWYSRRRARAGRLPRVEVLELLRARPLTAEDAAQTLGCSVKHAYNILWYLVREGLAVRLPLACISSDKRRKPYVYFRRSA